MSLEDLSNINVATYPIPEVPQAVGELIAEISIEDPDAIVIDRVGRQIIVYPKGTASDRPELTESSITSLLNEFVINMLGDEIESVSALLQSEEEDQHLALFCHPSKKDELSCIINNQIQLLPTKVVSPNFLLLCCRGKKEKYRLKGAILKTS